MNILSNFAGDPFNSDAVAEYMHIQSDGYGGSYDDLLAPASANFPLVTPTRYFLYLPFVPDQTDLAGARPMLVKDVTGGVALTRVSGAPGVNQYRLAPDDSRTPHVIELNSGQAGNVIGVDYYAVGSIASADRFLKLLDSDTPVDWSFSNPQVNVVVAEAEVTAIQPGEHYYEFLVSFDLYSTNKNISDFYYIEFDTYLDDVEVEDHVVYANSRAINGYYWFDMNLVFKYSGTKLMNIGDTLNIKLKIDTTNLDLGGQTFNFTAKNIDARLKAEII